VKLDFLGVVADLIVEGSSLDLIGLEIGDIVEDDDFL
jgi:hypothetical protein